MTTLELLSRVLKSDIKLWVEDGRLRYNAPRGIMTPELQAELVEHKTEIITYLQASNPSGSATILPIERPQNIPLSFAQQRLWFMEQIQPGNAANHMFQAVPLHGHIDISALEGGIRQVVKRHEVLRTTFQAIDGEPYQIIAPDMPVPLSVIDLSNIHRPGQDAESQRLARSEAMRPFDLASGPLLRCVLLRLADDQHILLLTIHHIISDGWSMGILFREIDLFGQAFAHEEQPALPDLPLQYADYAIWQRNQLSGDVYARQLNYWQERLQDAPDILELPTDKKRPAISTYRGARLSIELSRELIAPLQVLSHQEGGTLFVALLAAFQALLSLYAGKTDIVVGSPVSNRGRGELEGLIGPFVNNLVLRTDISGDPTFRALLRRVNEVCLGAYEHQDIPFEKLVDELKIPRNLGRNPLFQAMFVVQGGQKDRLDASIEEDQGTTQFDLRVALQETPAGIVGFFEYSTDLFERDTIALLIELYCQILETWGRNPGKALSEILPPEALAAKQRQHHQTIAIAATFMAEPVEESLAFWMKELDLPSKIEFSPYNQVFQQLLDPASLFSCNLSGVNVILLCWEDWLRETRPDDPAAFFQRNLADLESALLHAAQKAAVPFLVLLCPASPGDAAIAQKADLYRSLQEHFIETLATCQNVLVVPPDELARHYPVQEYYDTDTNELGHVPYTPAMFAAIGTLLARKIHAWHTLPHKVIVLDCDYTLWHGVCAEDGPLGVEVDWPYRELQNFACQQQKQGKLLCLCSKNEEADVWDVFNQQPNMLLTRQDLTAWRINWLPKSENLRALAQELQLGLDSFILIDDNPVECAEVRTHCPQVLVVELPQEPEKIPSILNHQWAFDQIKVTSEDQRRTQMYQENLARQNLQAGAPSFEKFIAELELQITIEKLSPARVERVAQLTQRTNQFNTTTLRRTAAEVQALCMPDHGNCSTVDVCDRFGDYGLVGAMFYEAGQTALVVDSFLLSCRALGRGVEEQMLTWLGEEAQRLGLEQVQVRYLPSSKNRPMLNFLEKVGQEHRQAQGEGYLFCFPLEVLKTLKGKIFATQAGTQTSEMASIPQEQAQRSASKNTLEKISHELGDAEKILNVIQAQKAKRDRNEATFVAPRTPVEQHLAEIWKGVLHIEQVGVHDNFFDLGGDSLLAMRVIARAKKESLHLMPGQIFQHPTLIELAAAVNTPDNRLQMAPP